MLLLSFSLGPPAREMMLPTYSMGLSFSVKFFLGPPSQTHPEMCFLGDSEYLQLGLDVIQVNCQNGNKVEIPFLKTYLMLMFIIDVELFTLSCSWVNKSLVAVSSKL